MSLIHINNSNIVLESIPGISDIYFNYIGEKATAIQSIDTLAGVFISDQIIADTGFVRWLDVIWTGERNDFNVGFYVRSGRRPLTNEKWVGPYYNKNFEIGSQRGKYLQFMVCMVTDTTYVPKVYSVNVRYITSNTATKFYTKAFSLGFKPETILLTFNASINADTIIKFAVSGDDSIDPLDYQFIEPNKIETLTEISVFSDKIKILMELSGEFSSDLAVHEFSFIVGGNEATRINKVELESSSQSMSTDSSMSSSSSIDSSSSFSSSSSSSSY